MKANIETMTDVIEREVQLEGIIVARNIHTRWFRFIEGTSGNSYSGYIRRDAIAAVRHIPLGSPCRVVLETVNVRINRVTGVRKPTYALRSVEALPPEENQ